MTFSRFSGPLLITIPLKSALKHRHLLKEFVARDIKGRFAGSVAGTLWTLINPVATIAIFLFIFSLVLRIRVTAQETGTDKFVIFFLSGMFPWLIFSEGLTRSVGCLVDNANLITKVVFPVELLPLSAILSALVVNGIGMCLFLIYLVPAGYIHRAWFFLFILIPAQTAFTWGLACLLAAACVFFRDIREILGIVLMLWFYATPIIYPLSMVPKPLQPYFGLNPLGVFIILYRQILLLHEMSWHLLALACAVSFLAYALGAWFFMKAKPAFGDVL